MRGIAVINMVIYHLLYDLKYMFLANISFSTEKFYIWQQSICISFIIIAGISLNFNSKKLKQGLKLLAVSVIISALTHVFIREFAIYFGIIHFLALGVISISIFESFIDRLPALTGLILNMSAFLFYRSNFFNSSEFYRNVYGFLSKFKLGFILGFPSPRFYSSDYFPIFPWIFLLLFGYFLGKIINFDKILNINKKNILVKIGQNSLIIYLAHQVIIYSVVSIIFS